MNTTIVDGGHVIKDSLIEKINKLESKKSSKRTKLITQVQISLGSNLKATEKLNQLKS